ncbi:MAG: proton-conducting transporter membrane subunit [Gammaproteobacteria bacterium]
MNILIALPGLPLLAALWFALVPGGDRRAAGWVTALAALFPVATATLVQSQRLEIPHLLVRGSSALVLDDAARPALLLFGALWLAAALVARSRSSGPAAIPMLLALSGASTLALADGRPLVYASMLATGYGLYAMMASESDADWRRPARALIVLLIASDLLVFEVLLHAAAYPEHGISGGVLTVLMIAIVLRSGAPPAHVWLPPALAAVSTPTAIVLAGVPAAAAFVGAGRLLPAEVSGIAGACLGLGLAGALWASAAGIAQSTPRATLGYASAASAALLLATVPLTADPAAAAWTTLALMGCCATLPVIAGQHDGPARNAAITLTLLIHGFAGAHAAAGTWAGTTAAGLAAAAVAVLATLLLTLAVRRTSPPRRDDGSVEASTMAIAMAGLAATGLAFLWRASLPGFASFWPVPIGITLGLVFYRWHPQGTSLRVPPGDLLVPAERTLARLITVTATQCRQRLPRMRDRLQQSLLSAWRGDAWAARIARLEYLLRAWPTTGVLVLLVAIAVALLVMR